MEEKEILDHLIGLSEAVKQINQTQFQILKQLVVVNRHVPGAADADLRLVEVGPETTVQYGDLLKQLDSMIRRLKVLRQGPV
jgi:hypothetical protein